MGIRRNKTILEQAADYVEAAVEKAGPILADARDQAVAKAGPVLVDARDKATPLIAQSAALAAEKAGQGKDLASAKAAELTGKPKKKHRLRKLLIFTGIAAALGFVAKKLTSGGDKDNWQGSYTPAPPPAPRASDTPIADAAEATTDQGGAAPGEALADATEEPHDVTTPDEPADVVDVAPGEEPVEKKSGKP